MREQPGVSGLRAVALIARKELRAQRTLFLAWLVPLGTLLAMIGRLEPQFAGENSLLAAKLAAMPEQAKLAFGLSADFSRPAGYVATNFLLVTLGGAMFAALLGASLMSREHAQRTAEALLTLPVSRAQVLGGKVLAALSMLAVFHATLATVILGVFSQVIAGDIEAGLIIAMFVGTAMVDALFLCIGFGLGALLKEPRSAPNFSLGLVVCTYFLGALSRISPQVEAASQFSPFNLVDPAHLIQTHGLEARSGLLVLAAFSVLAFTLTRYQRRDLHA